MKFYTVGSCVRAGSQSPADDNPLVVPLRRLVELLVLFGRSFEELFREILVLLSQSFFTLA